MASKRSDRATWLRHARAWKKSGLSCAEFAKRERLNAATLSWWAWKLRAAGEEVPGGRKPRTRRREQSGGKPRSKATFLELTPVITGTSSGVELEAAGVVLRLSSDFDEAHLVRVLDVLEGRR